MDSRLPRSSWARGPLSGELRAGRGLVGLTAQSRQRALETLAGPRRREASPPHPSPWGLYPGQTPTSAQGSCCRYSGERSATNMAIIEAKLPSGYTPVKSSLRQVSFPGRRTGRASHSMKPGADPWGRAQTPRRTQIAALTPRGSSPCRALPPAVGHCAALGSPIQSLSRS